MNVPWVQSRASVTSGTVVLRRPPNRIASIGTPPRVVVLRRQDAGRPESSSPHCRPCSTASRVADVEVVEPRVTTLASASPSIIRTAEATEWLRAHGDLRRSPATPCTSSSRSTRSTRPMTPSPARCSTATVGHRRLPGVRLGRRRRRGALGRVDRRPHRPRRRGLGRPGHARRHGPDREPAARHACSANILESGASLGSHRRRAARPWHPAARPSTCQHCGYPLVHPRAVYCPKCGMRMLHA